MLRVPRRPTTVTGRRGPRPARVVLLVLQVTAAVTGLVAGGAAQRLLAPALLAVVGLQLLVVSRAARRGDGPRDPGPPRRLRGVLRTGRPGTARAPRAAGPAKGAEPAPGPGGPAPSTPYTRRNASMRALRRRLRTHFAPAPTPAPATAGAGAAGPPPDGSAPPPVVGRRARTRTVVLMTGPAVVVSMAYVDPGNFASNMTAGARYGMMLLWVIVLANVIAMFVQYLASKAGIVSGRSLAELCRDHTPRPVRWPLWAQAELVAMATDLAEFVGGAVALHLLFGIPLLPAAVIIGVVSLVLLALAPDGKRRFEVTIGAFLVVILVAFVYQSLSSGSWDGAASGLTPRFAGADSLLLATGMVGATVMPHAIYLHSALGARHAGTGPAQQRALLRANRTGIVIALGAAGFVNATMLTIAATAFSGANSDQTLESIHSGLGSIVGPGAALAFALALLASGLASSSVGTCAGQVIMQGFLRRQVPLLVRRLVTMTPPLVVLALGIDPTWALVLSQVVLSFGIPFALVPLVIFTSRRSVMGPLVNRPLTTAIGTVAVLLISALNVFLIGMVATEGL